MKPSIKINSKQAQPFAKIAFPDYTGRKFRVEYSEKITLHDLNWGDGTRNWYTVLEIETGLKKNVSVVAPYFEKKEGQTVEIKPGYMVVCYSEFCGHVMGLTFHIHPQDAPKFLEVK